MPARRKASGKKTRTAARSRAPRGLPILVTVNGKRYERNVEPRVLLVDFLRDHLRLTGVHVGCDSSQCGACTILVDWRPVKSCSMLAVQADGTQLTTIEGLAHDGQMHPLQEAFRDHLGLQCGYCTPGVVLAAYAFLRTHPDPTEEEIRVAISGNLCRCTGYQGIVKSIAMAASRGAGGA